MQRLLDERMGEGNDFVNLLIYGAGGCWRYSWRARAGHACGSCTHAGCRSGAEVVAFDFAEEMIARAAAHLEPAGGIDYRADGRTRPFCWRWAKDRSTQPPA
jgi:hypothetical protein